jgi:hypothetical protein
LIINYGLEKSRLYGSNIQQNKQKAMCGFADMPELCGALRGAVHARHCASLLE